MQVLDAVQQVESPPNQGRRGRGRPCLPPDEKERRIQARRIVKAAKRAAKRKAAAQEARRAAAVMSHDEVWKVVQLATLWNWSSWAT
jgi:hypothetical protein